ncbi:MAG TPA: Ig-like domain-containing protein [Kofleriaceae bacterium]|nr:Ig-like domain-containing protein [Kofleriaceae bacterium]
MKRATRGFWAWLVSALVLAGCGSVSKKDEPDGGGGGDTTPPTVTGTTPAAKAAGVATGGAITATFSEAMDEDTLTDETFQLTADGTPVPGGVTYDGLVATFTPDAPLAGGTPYLATITTGAEDAAGNALAEPHEWSFTTATTTCVVPGGGGGCQATISAAIAASSAGDSIAVAEGTYGENVVIDRTVTLLGGYSGDFAERDPAAHESRIQPSNLAEPVVRINGDAADTAAIAPTVDGFTVTGGRSQDHGGAFHIRSSDALLRGNLITGNQGFFLGGGLYITGGAARLLRNTIQDNAVVGQEGSGGGGVLLEGTRATLIDNLIAGNQAAQDTDYGGGVGVQGGGPVILQNNRIEGNQAGGLNIAGDGGGVWISNAQVTITGDTIVDNELGTTGSGGGVFAQTSQVAIQGAVIENNAAGTSPTGSDGSGVAVETMSTLVLTSSVVAGNRNGLAGVWVGVDSSATVVNCTIADNPGKGLRTEKPLSLANSIFLAEDVGVAVEAAAPVAAFAISNDFFDVATPAAGFDLDDSNLTLDPRLDDTFHLAEDSPLLDVGVPGPFTQAGTAAMIDLPDRDIDGEPRVMIGPSDARRVDIGADERTGPVE